MSLRIVDSDFTGGVGVEDVVVVVSLGFLMRRRRFLGGTVRFPTVSFTTAEEVFSYMVILIEGSGGVGVGGCNVVCGDVVGLLGGGCSRKHCTQKSSVCTNPCGTLVHIGTSGEGINVAQSDVS